MRIQFSLYVLLSCVVLPCFSQTGISPQVDNRVRVEFETHYNAWMEWRENNRASSSLTENIPFKAIIALGPKALPFVIEKMNQQKNNFHLQRAVREMSKKRFERNAWPVGKHGDSVSLAKMYTDWWNNDLAKTSDKVRALLADKRSHEVSGNIEEASRITKQIENLGIAALPEVFELIAGGETSLVSTASMLTEGKLSNDASAIACSQWWSENKNSWSIPHPESPQTSYTK